MIHLNTIGRISIVFCLAGAAFAATAQEFPHGRKYSAAERITLPRLEALHADVQRLHAQRQPVEWTLPGLTDYRAIIHVHASDSDHTGGTREELLEAAKKTGVSIVMLSDHYRPPRDFITESWRGMYDGVLFIPGAEMRGFLLYPMESIMDKMEAPLEEFIPAVTAGQGLIFLSHVEERVDHPMDGLTGLEIYNRHYDAMNDGDLMPPILRALTEPERYAEMRHIIENYHQELFASQYDYPEVYVNKWDQETGARRLVGLAANDSHQNNTYLVKMVDRNTVLLGTNVQSDEQMRRVTAEMAPGILAMTEGHEPGAIIAELPIDDYEIALRDVSTHILAPELSESAVRAALAAGHAYVAHDWLCDPAGFVYAAMENGEVQAIMGDELQYRDSLTLAAEFPVSCTVRLLRNGVVVGEEQTRRFEYNPTEPGVYRVEGWVTVDAEERCWIYSNPVYLRP